MTTIIISSCISFIIGAFIGGLYCIEVIAKHQAEEECEEQNHDW